MKSSPLQIDLSLRPDLFLSRELMDGFEEDRFIGTRLS
jgi:hypothetical protein